MSQPAPSDAGVTGGVGRLGPPLQPAQQPTLQRPLGPSGGRGIGRLVVRRVLWMAPVLALVLIITFALLHLAPGNPWDQNAGDNGAHLQLSPTAIGHLNAKYGLDRPWWDQLSLYVRHALRFDFGDSYRYPGEAASHIILARLRPTVTLTGAALACIVPIGVGLGVLAALRHNGWIDRAVTGLATLAASVPNFVIGIVLIMALSVGLNHATKGAFFLPAGGYGVDRRLIMPVITLSLLPITFMSRMTRTSTLNTLRQDYVRTAQAKGLPRSWFLLRHVLKNSLVPVITTIGPLIVFLISGSVVIESLFRVPGIGSAFVAAVAARDYPVVLAASLFYAAVVLVGNLMVDIAYVVIDPRVRPA